MKVTLELTAEQEHELMGVLMFRVYETETSARQASDRNDAYAAAGFAFWRERADAALSLLNTFFAAIGGRPRTADEVLAAFKKFEIPNAPKPVSA